MAKISTSGQNFLAPPIFKKGPTEENVHISYLLVNIKFWFFKIQSVSQSVWLRYKVAWFVFLVLIQSKFKV